MGDLWHVGAGALSRQPASISSSGSEPSSRASSLCVFRADVFRADSQQTGTDPPGRVVAVPPTGFGSSGTVNALHGLLGSVAVCCRDVSDANLCRLPDIGAAGCISEGQLARIRKSGLRPERLPARPP